jgi:general stress protein 26
MNTARLPDAVAFLRTHKIVHLATAADNIPTVRVMSVAHVEDDGTVWLASLAVTEKVQQIVVQPKVALSAYADGTTLEMAGTARIITDVETKRRLWHESWQPYYPNGHDDPDYVLIVITPTEITLY